MSSRPTPSSRSRYHTLQRRYRGSPVLSVDSTGTCLRSAGSASAGSGFVRHNDRVQDQLTSPRQDRLGLGRRSNSRGRLRSGNFFSAGNFGFSSARARSLSLASISLSSTKAARLQALSVMDRANACNVMKALTDAMESCSNLKKWASFFEGQISNLDGQINQHKSSLADIHNELFEHYCSVAQTGRVAYMDNIQGCDHLPDYSRLYDRMMKTKDEIAKLDHLLAENEIAFDNICALCKEEESKVDTAVRELQGFEWRYKGTPGGNPFIKECLQWVKISNKETAKKAFAAAFNVIPEEYEAEMIAAREGGNAQDGPGLVQVAAEDDNPAAHGAYPATVQKLVTEHLASSFPGKVNCILPLLTKRSQGRKLNAAQKSSAVRFCEEKGLASNEGFKAAFTKPEAELKLLYKDHVVDGLPNIHIKNAIGDVWYDRLCLYLQLEDDGGETEVV